MGMFDTITAQCTCGGFLFFQSKSGPCRCDEFTLDNVPRDVLQDVNRHSPMRCNQCNKWWEVCLITRKLNEVANPELKPPYLVNQETGEITDFKHMGTGKFSNYDEPTAYDRIKELFDDTFKDFDSEEGMAKLLITFVQAGMLCQRTPQTEDLILRCTKMGFTVATIMMEEKCRVERIKRSNGASGPGTKAETMGGSPELN